MDCAVSQGMYANAQSVLARISDMKFEVKVWVHQGSVLSPLLFIIVLKALSCEFLAGFLGRTYMQMILSSLPTPWWNVSGGS